MNRRNSFTEQRKSKDLDTQDVSNQKFKKKTSIEKLEGNLVWHFTPQTKSDPKRGASETTPSPSSNLRRTFYCDPQKQVVYHIFEDLGLRPVGFTENWNIGWCSRQQARQILANRNQSLLSTTEPPSKDHTPLPQTPASPLSDKVWFVNHFVDAAQLTDKDLMYLNCKDDPEASKVVPLTWVLPAQKADLEEYFEKSSTSTNKNTSSESQVQGLDQTDTTSARKILIVKPTQKARGLGIEVIDSYSQLKKIMQRSEWSEKYVVSKYIDNPLLVQQKKVDLRVYVFVRRFWPQIEALYYPNWIVRFCANVFSLDRLGDFGTHIPTFWSARTLECEASTKKWYKADLWKHLMSFGVQEHQLIKLEDDVKSVLKVTLNACRKNIRESEPSFELFGFDILIDSNFRPWLIEVNSSPNMDPSSEQDFWGKYEMLKDMMCHVDFEGLFPPLPSDSQATQTLFPRN